MRKLLVICGALLVGCALWGDTSPTVAEGPGISITLDELDAHAKESLFQERTRGQATRVYELRAEVLDELIEELVLEAEAKRRGVSIDALIEQETQDVSEAEVAALFEESRSQLRDGTRFDDVREAIREHLENQRIAEAVQALVASADVATRLEPPRIDVAADGPSIGPADAPITIVEFSDFQCPFCRRAGPVMKQLLLRYPEKIRLVYRHFPLDSIHPRARAAAEASACAADQDRFWEFHDLIFGSPAALEDEELREHAEALGLDLSLYDFCVTGRTHQASVDVDAEAAREVGISGTPAFVVNGVLLTGAQPVEAFERVIDRELRALSAAP